MTAHTPGPWQITDGMLKESGGVLEAAGRIVCPYCAKQLHASPVQIGIVAKGWGVAQIGSLDPKAEHDQHMANARLIAAAPAMRDLLELAYSVLRECSDEAGDDARWNEGGDGYKAATGIRAILAEIERQDPQ